jgi:hypothetical protein
MTQVGEAVTAPDCIDEFECPFDHSTEEPPAIENNFIGDGGKLKSRMKSGSSTHKYAYNPTIKTGAGAVEKTLPPRDLPDHPCAKGKKPVSIRSADGTSKTFGVSCAAHHCIPSQESLKRSKLLEFMVKKGKNADVKQGKATVPSDFTGKARTNVGYDTNGAENGIFLPGSYAVGGWKDWADPLDDDEITAAIADAEPSAFILNGRVSVDDDNPRWRYVREAVQLAGGQFHDRHEKYSDFVLSVLDKLHERYTQLEKKNIDEGLCGKCKERAKKKKDEGVPTPFVLVQHLNGVSRKLAGWLNGKVWKKNIYTSKWGLVYMAHLKTAK